MIEHAPAKYEAWYATDRGRWIADREFALLAGLLRPRPGATLIDVGTGTGHFARRFAATGLAVTGLDPNRAALDYARTLGGEVAYLEGDARELPFADDTADYCSAITSLCFVADPARSLAEMWRVARLGVALGLLHSHSLLHRRKAGQGAYAGARWDDASAVETWVGSLQPPPQALELRYAVFLPDGGAVARLLERSLPATIPWGGFLAISLHKTPH